MKQETEILFILEALRAPTQGNISGPGVIG